MILLRIEKEYERHRQEGRNHAKCFIIHMAIQNVENIHACIQKLSKLVFFLNFQGRLVFHLAISFKIGSNAILFQLRLIPMILAYFSSSPPNFFNLKDYFIQSIY